MNAFSHPGPAVPSVSAEQMVDVYRVMKEKARPWLGELYLGDIGVPPQVHRRFGYDVEGLFLRRTFFF
jgi:hypothetical protein